MYEQIPNLLVAVYVFVVAILLLILVYARLHWIFKAGLIGVSFIFFILSYRSYSDLSGLPALKTPPKQLLFISTIVREPAGSFKGAIYLWVRPIVDGKATDVPQAFAINYDKELHKRMNEARGKNRQGHKVILEASMVDDDDEDDNQADGYQRKHLDIVISKAERPQLPEKSLLYMRSEDANEQ